MSQIGTLGPIVFQVNSDVVRTFAELSRKKSPRWAQHETAETKPKQQFIGPGADDISFVMTFDAENGVNPRREMDNLSLMADGGKAYRLVLGGKPIGNSGLWVITSLETTFTSVDNRGNVLRGTAAISLREYR